MHASSSGKYQNRICHPSLPILIDNPCTRTSEWIFSYTHERSSKCALHHFSSSSSPFLVTFVGNIIQEKNKKWIYGYFSSHLVIYLCANLLLHTHSAMYKGCLYVAICVMAVHKFSSLTRQNDKLFRNSSFFPLSFSPPMVLAITIQLEQEEAIGDGEKTIKRSIKSTPCAIIF